VITYKLMPFEIMPQWQHIYKPTSWPSRAVSLWRWQFVPKH